MRRLGLAVLLLAAAVPATANTYNVTSTADAGAGSLRQAILDANANPGADTITFNIVGSGPHTILLGSALPDITGAVTIDGYTQAGSSPNTHSTNQGLDTVLQIEIESGGASPCLVSKAGDTTIRGLAVYHCSTAAIQLLGSVANNVVAGNFLGTRTDGETIPVNGNVSSGVLINQQTGARVGGTTPADRNLISGFNSSQVRISGGSGHLVQGNLIAMKASGLETLRAVGGPSNGVLATAGTALLVGGSAAEARNVFGNITTGVGIQGNTGVTIQGNFFGTDVTGQKGIIRGVFINDGFAGISLLGTGSVQILGNTIAGVYEGIQIGSGPALIQGNFIGTDAAGTLDLGTQGRGITMSGGTGIVIGGIVPGEGNTIAYNGKNSGPSAGIFVSGGQAAIRGNSIFGNRQVSGVGGLGIDLDVFSGSGGVTPNDLGDGDGGGNGRQNFPVLTSAAPAAPQGSGTHVQGTLNSAAATTFDLDFYSICNLRPAELLEGKTYIGSTQVTTDGSGNASFDVVLPVTIASGELVTSTATDPGGNTSEFSQQLVFTGNPPLGPAAGGTVTTLKGMLFEAGATVTVGGVPATSVNVVDAQTITSSMPALTPGTVNDVVVSNPSGSSGTLTNGWAADFLDVPPANLFHSAVWLLVHNDVTAGIGGGNYGVNNGTLRQQMAVFLLKGKYGVCYAPPPCAHLFPDVACPSTFADWIEALAAEGITGGCGGGNYCPGNPVLRQQMAVFLLKAEHGSAYAPPACTGAFVDVACPSSFADWIEQLAAENITGGCGGGNFCPTNTVTRGQMSAFLSLAFHLQ